MYALRELSRINIRNVLMSGDSCQVKWGSVMQDNTILFGFYRSDVSTNTVNPREPFVIVRGRTY